MGTDCLGSIHGLALCRARMSLRLRLVWILALARLTSLARSSLCRRDMRLANSRLLYPMINSAPTRTTANTPVRLMAVCLYGMRYLDISIATASSSSFDTFSGGCSFFG